MNLDLRIGGIRFRIDCDSEIICEESFAPFFCTSKNVSDVNITFTHDYSQISKPDSTMLGEDLLMEYYRHDGRLLTMAKGSKGSHLSCCVSSSDDHVCHLNFAPGGGVNTLGGLLRLVPIRQILLKHGVLFLHASQIAVGNTGILFSAPSGTGKTTQARLWHKFRNAELLCNDRTLTDGENTYGYPFDGSEPVCCGEVRRLGAIVTLEQAPENSIRRLKPREALARLMPQAVIDVWDPHSRTAAAELLLTLLTRTPVYLLRCSPDENAVACLEQQLMKDGVINHE